MKMASEKKLLWREQPFMLELIQMKFRMTVKRDDSCTGNNRCFLLKIMK